MTASDGPDRPAPPPRQPIFNAPRATTGLCLVLLAAFLLSRFGGVAPGSLTGRLAFDAQAFTGQFEPGGAFDAWSWLALVGHGLLHVDVTHFLINTLMLLAFGSLVERTLGAGALLLVAAAAAVAGALALAVTIGGTPAYMVGASDSVHGVAGVAAVIMRRRGTAQLRHAGGVLLAFMVGINLVLALVGGGAGLIGFAIAWQAHLGGLAAGLALAPLLLRRVERRT